MTDPINQEVKIGIIDVSHPELEGVEKIQQDSMKEFKHEHGTGVCQALINAIKADGTTTNQNKTKIQSYITDCKAGDVKTLKLALSNNNLITRSVSPCSSMPDLTEKGRFFSKIWEKEIYKSFKDVLMFNTTINTFDDFFTCYNSCYEASANNHFIIPVSAIYYKKEFEYKIDKFFMLLSNIPGTSVFIADNGFSGFNVGASDATPRVAGSSGVIAYRHLKNKTEGDFLTLAKKYLGSSAKHIKQDELFDGWETEAKSKYLRDIDHNRAQDYNFGKGLGFSYEHGAGENDSIAFYNLCQSHLQEFDLQLVEDKIFFHSVKPTSERTKKIVFEFDCGDNEQGYINGVYFAFKGLKEVDIKTISVESPSGTKSEFVNDHTSLCTSINTLVGKRSKNHLEFLEKFLEKNMGRRYESNRHFGEKTGGKWKAIIETYDEITIDQEVEFSLDFRNFNYINKNNNMQIINNNIFDSDKEKFVYQSDNSRTNGLNYFNLAATSSANEINLKEKKATLTFTHPHPKIRTLYDLEDYEKSLKEPVTPKVVNVTIDPNTAVDYIADGSGNGKLTGNELNNKLLGLSGDDELYGEEGDDHLYPGTAKTIDKGFGGPGNDTHYVISREPGEYWVRDDKEGHNAVVFNVSYEESIERVINDKTKEISYNSNYKPLTLDDIKFTKTSDTEYWMQGGNKKVRFDPAEIQSVVLKHSLTGEVRTLDRSAVASLCSR